MNEIIQILYQFLPIVIGMAFLFAIRSLNLANSKVQVSTPQSGQLVEGYVFKRSYEPHLQKDAIVKEQLIITGKLPKKKTSDIYDYAMRHAGIVRYTNLKDVLSSLKQSKASKLTILFNHRSPLLLSLMQPNTATGIILAYSIEQNLDLVGQCT